MINKSPLITMLRKESEASQFLEIHRHPNSPPIAVIEVYPKEHSHTSLGLFNVDTELEGFALEISPHTVKKSVAVQLTKLSAEYNEHEFILHIANYSEQSINVDVSVIQAVHPN